MRSVTDTQPHFHELCKVGHRQDRMMEAASLSDIAGRGQLSFTMFSALRQLTFKV